MKVLQLINSLYTGGAEKLIVDSVPLYQQAGIEMDVLCLKKEETPFWKLLETKTNGKIFGLSKGSVYNPLRIFEIIPYLKQYDLIHAHIFPTLYWVVLAKWLSFSKIKIVYTEHNTTNRRQSNLIFRYMDRWIYKGITINACITEKVKENLKKHLNLKDESRFALIENGVNIANFTEAVTLSKSTFFSQNDFILIQVAAFREQKDQPTLIKAMCLLKERFKLLLVGEGIERTDCEQLVQKLNLQERVKFLGNRTDVPQLLQMADAAVLSSHYEGLSLSSIEGMSVKPFIASDVPGLRDIVGGYGLLFTQGNAEELAQLIQKLEKEPTFYQEIKQRCHKRALDFDIQKMVDNYISVYQNVLRNTKKR